MLEIEKVTVISNKMRVVVESEWPELAHEHGCPSRHAAPCFCRCRTQRAASGKSLWHRESCRHPAPRLGEAQLERRPQSRRPRIRRGLGANSHGHPFAIGEHNVVPLGLTCQKLS